MMILYVLQAHMAEKDKEKQAQQVRIQRQQADIEQLRNQYRTAQQNYDRQVQNEVDRLTYVEWRSLQGTQVFVDCTPGRGTCSSCQQAECSRDYSCIR